MTLILKKTKTYLLALALVIFLLTSLQVFAEEELVSEDLPAVLEYLTRDDGLSNLSVSSIVEDKYGILWFGTQGGLNRYDGKSIVTYRNNPFDKQGLGHNLIQTLTYDPHKHELWIGTYQGISRYNIYEDTFVNYTVADDKLSNEVVVSILIDQDTVWAATLDGLNKIDPSSHQITTYDIPEKTIRDLILASDGVLYLASHDGVYFYDETLDDLVQLPLDLPSPYVMTIDEFDQGILTIGMWDGGLADIQLKSRRITYTSFDDNRIYTVLETSDGSRWVGTWGGGLYAIDDDGVTYHYPGSGKKNDLSHNVVYSLYQSSSNILWVGTNGGGLVKINPRKRNYVSLSHDPDQEGSLSHGKINLLYRDIRDQLWIAVYNSGIERYDPQSEVTVKYTSKNQVDFGNNITSVVELDPHHFLIGSEVGLSLYNRIEDTFEAYDIGLGPKIIYAMLKDGQTLWIGTYREGLYAYDLLDKSLVHYGTDEAINVLSDNLIYNIFKDSQDRLWVASNNGLNLKLPGQDTFKFYHKGDEDLDQLPNNNTRLIFEDTTHQIWVATSGGLSLYREDQDNFITFTEEDGLSNNMILAILEHDNTDLWLSTLDGISILNKSSKTFSTLTPEDGIGGYEFTAGHLKDKDGSLNFAGVHGITSIPPNFFAPVNIVPKLYIADVSVFQNSLAPPVGYFNNQSLIFEPKENMLTFNFLAIDYDAPDQVKYFYKLDPLSSQWIHTGSNDYITYSNLKAGKYTLWVYAQTSRGISTEPVRLHFEIKKPWYLSWSAFIVYILGFFMVIYIIIKLRESRMLKATNIRLEALSIKDALTGVYNRRYFDDIMEQQLQLAKRSMVPMGILMIDIDDFKTVNDTMGHLAGDQVLKEIAIAIESLLQRSTDFVARYGGDEFAIALYDTSIENVLAMARNIQERLATSSVTISIGAYSDIPRDDATVDDLISKADRHLYRSKAQGKNRISYNDASLDA